MQGQSLVSPSGEDEIASYVHADEVREAAKRLSFSKTMEVASESISTNKPLNDSNKGARQNTKKQKNLLNVVLRLRPKLGSKPEDETLVPATDVDVVATAPEESHSYKMGERETKFTFSRVFPTSTTQQQIFDGVCAPLLESLMNGGQGLLFAYGMTNAGKTYTIQGSEHNPGVLPRALDNIFSTLQEKYGYAGTSNTADDTINENLIPSFTVKASYLEIYNEKIYDLLKPAPKNAWEKRQALSLKEIRGRVVVKGLKHVQINNSKDAIEVAKQGLCNRAVAETALNSDSSRSHSIFTVTIFGFPGQKRPGKLSIIDLAGSERSDRTKSSGLRVREAGKINSSLMHLIHCIRQLRWNQTHPQGQNRIVPFRETRLTRLFQESFVGNTNGSIAMVVNCSTEAKDFDETLHVLKNASIARSVSVAQKESRVNSWRSLASLTKYGLNGRRRKRPAEESADELRAKTIGGPQRNANKRGGKCQRNPGKVKQANNKPVPKFVTKPKDGNDTVDEKNENLGAIQGVPQELVEKLKSQISDLQNDLATVETEVRIEMAQDFQERLEKTEEEYKNRYEQQIKLLEKKWKRKLSLARLSDVGRGRDSTGSASSSSSQLEEIECLDNQIAECEEEMDRMREYHQKELSLMKNDHAQIVQSYEEKVNQLQCTLKNTNMSQASEKVESQKLKEQMQDATALIQNKCIEIEKLKNEHQNEMNDNEIKFQKMTDGFKTKLEQKEDEIRNLKALQGDSNLKVKEQHEVIVLNLTKSNQSLKAQLEKLSDDKEEISQVVKQCQETNASLRERIKEIEKLKSKLQHELNETKNKQDRELTSAQESKASLKSRIETLEEEITSLKSEKNKAIENLRIIRNSQEEELDTFTQGMVDMEKENKELQATILGYAEKIKELQENLSIKSKEVDSEKTMKDRETEIYESKISDLQQQLESITKDKISIEKNHNLHLQHETRELKKQVEEQSVAIQELQTELVSENDKFVQMCDKYNSKIYNLEQTIEGSKVGNLKLKAKLEERENKIVRLNSRMKELTDLKNFNNKINNDVENASISNKKSAKKRSSNEGKGKTKRKKLSDINPSTMINVKDDDESMSSKKQQETTNEQTTETPKKQKVTQKRKKSSAQKFARTIKGSFRGFTSLMSRTGKTPNKANPLPSTTEESIASRTRSRRSTKSQVPR